VVEVCTFSTALISPLSEVIGLQPSYQYVFLMISVLFGYLTLLMYLQRLVHNTFMIFKKKNSIVHAHFSHVLPTAVDYE